MKFSFLLFSIFFCFCFIACKKKIPSYKVYNGLELPEIIKEKNENIPSKEKIVTTNLVNGRSIQAYKENFNGKPYYGCIQGYANSGIKFRLIVYFVAQFNFEMLPTEEIKMNKDDIQLKDEILMDNPAESVINPALERFLTSELVNKYGSKYETNEFDSYPYPDDSFRPGFKFSEKKWKYEYLNVSLLTLKDDWGFMGLRIIYTLTDDFWKDYKDEIKDIQKENSKF